MKNEGEHHQHRYISAANSCRELKMASIYCSDNVLLSRAQVYINNAFWQARFKINTFW